MAKKKSSSGKYGSPFVLEDVRCNYVYLVDRYKPEKEKGDGKFTATILLPQDDTDQVKRVTDAIKETAGVKKLSELDKHPLVDKKGNEKDGSETDIEGYEGCYFFAAGSGRRPEVYAIDDDGDLVEVDDDDEIRKDFYNGARYNVVLQPHEYEEGEVTFYLQGIVKVGDDQKFRGSVDSKSMLLASLAGGALKGTKKRKKAIIEESPIEEEEDEEEEEVAPKKKKVTSAKKATATKKAVEEDEEDDDEEEEEVAPKKKAATSKKASLEEDDEEEEVAPKKRERKSKNDAKSFLD